MRDEKYAAGQVKIIPSVAPERIIGVRTPALRDYAKELYADKEKETGAFLNELPHRYFDEDQLHAFIISLEKDFDKCIAEVEKFLPYVDNWATCDQLSPKAFKKQPEKLLPYIDKWLASGRTYTVRFAIGMLMQHFLDGRFSPEYPKAVARVRSDEYYVKMMVAWYFATALAKQYAAIIPYIENRTLDAWTHNRAIQKSIESFRITPEQKEFLRSLKVKTQSSGSTGSALKSSECLIRPEREEDYRIVENLIRESFWNVYRPGCSEHYVIHVLRDDPAFVKDLDFVMEKDGVIIGQNMFMRTVIEADGGGTVPVLTMGPICIAPALKRKGYGKYLLDRTLEKATELGYGAVLFEGNIGFYGNCGFTYAREFGIRYHDLPEGADSSFFLCKELIPGYLGGVTGVYQTPKGYYVDDADVEAFDAAFPKKEKLKLPGQIFD